MNVPDNQDNFTASQENTSDFTKENADENSPKTGDLFPLVPTIISVIILLAGILIRKREDHS